MSTGLHHIILTVKDPAKSLPFYRDVLGFETTEEADGTFWFMADGVTIYVYPPRKPIAADRFNEERIGLDHLSFTAPDKGWLDALAAKLIGAGVETKGVECFEASGNWYIALRDPDNIQLEYWLP